MGSSDAVDARNPAGPDKDLIYQEYRNSSSIVHIYIYIHVHRLMQDFYHHQYPTHPLAQRPHILALLGSAGISYQAFGLWNPKTSFRRYFGCSGILGEDSAGVTRLGRGQQPV